MKKLILILLCATLNLSAATVIFSENFDGFTVPAGGYTNLVCANRSTATTPAAFPALGSQWSMPYNDGTGGCDIVSATHPFAPLGTGSNFLDPIGVKDTTILRLVVTNMVAGASHTLQFKAAYPNDPNSPPNLIGLSVQGWTNVFADEKPPKLPLQGAIVILAQYARVTSTLSGSLPTNQVTTLTTNYYPVSVAQWSTNHWITNAFQFVSPTTYMEFFFTAGGQKTTGTGVLIDDIVLTAD